MFESSSALSSWQQRQRLNAIIAKFTWLGSWKSNPKVIYWSTCVWNYCYYHYCCCYCILYVIWLLYVVIIYIWYSYHIHVHIHLFMKFTSTFVARHIVDETLVLWNPLQTCALKGVDLLWFWCGILTSDPGRRECYRVLWHIPSK